VLHLSRLVFALLHDHISESKPTLRGETVAPVDFFVALMDWVELLGGDE
jgi:hypothetical protein